MIYVKESFNIHPASPATRDRFVEVMGRELMPAGERLGARLVGAWFCHEEWFSQIVHVTEFDDLAAYAGWREAASADDPASKGLEQLAALAPERGTELLEPLGPIPVASLHAAIAESKEAPSGLHTFAILEVAPGKMDPFRALLGAAKDTVPIVACWGDLAGNPRRVIDLWKGDIGHFRYRPNDEGQEAFFGPLREIAPRERMMRLHPLPYSPLQ